MGTRKKKAEEAIAKREQPVSNAQSKGVIPAVTELKGKADTAPSGMPKSPTFSQMLAPMRQAAIKDKTDAAKMQKYYALSDALGAIGKMGGAAIGGAIGGNMLDSAPMVGEFKESRGYLDAFERAKQANERLRKLDDMEFNLALSKQQRDEERAYKAKVDAQAWARKQVADAQARAFQKEMIDYKAQKDANAAKTAFENKLTLVDKEHENAKVIQGMKNEATKAQHNNSASNIKLQYDLYNPKVPIAFDNGTAVEVSKTDYNGMLQFFNGKDFGEGRKVNKDNFGIFLRQNPQLVQDYLTLMGRGEKAAQPAAAPAQAPQQATPIVPAAAEPVEISNGLDWYNQWKAKQPYDSVNAQVSADEVKKQFSGFKI